MIVYHRSEDCGEPDFLLLQLPLGPEQLRDRLVLETAAVGTASEGEDPPVEGVRGREVGGGGGVGRGDTAVTERASALQDQLGEQVWERKLYRSRQRTRLT